MRYEFVLADRPSDAVLSAFPELRLAPAPRRTTTLYGPVDDGAALVALLARFGDLGLEVVDLHRLPD